jgi:hypothetical protein
VWTTEEDREAANRRFLASIGELPTDDDDDPKGDLAIQEARVFARAG